MITRFQKISNLILTQLVRPYFWGVAAAVALNSVPLSSSLATNDYFIVALMIGIGVSSFIGFPVVLLLWIAQATVKIAWKTPAGEKTSRFFEEAKKATSSFAVSAFLSCWVFLLARIKPYVVQTFEKFNPLITPKSLWNEGHYFVAFTAGAILVLIVTLVLVTVVMISTRLARLIKAQRKKWVAIKVF